MDQGYELFSVADFSAERIHNGICALADYSRDLRRIDDLATKTDDGTGSIRTEYERDADIHDCLYRVHGLYVYAGARDLLDIPDCIDRRTKCNHEKILPSENSGN